MRKVVIVLELEIEEADKFAGVLEVGSDDGQDLEIASLTASSIREAIAEKPEGDVGIHVISTSTIPNCGEGAMLGSTFDPADYEDEEIAGQTPEPPLGATAGEVLSELG